MKLSENQITKIGVEVFKYLSDNDSVDVKEGKEKILSAVKNVIKENMEAEAALDKKVNLMMDELERQQATQFERYKMFPLLKKKLAEQEGFVL